MNPAIVWFRSDIRLADHPALHAAAAAKRPLVCVYIHSENPDPRPGGPWTVTADQLATAQVRPGKTYPHPIVDHDKARNRALRNLKLLA